MSRADPPLVARAKARLNWMAAHHRSACNNCQHAVEVPKVDSQWPNFRCEKGCFMTSAMAVCEKHVVKANTLAQPVLMFKRETSFSARTRP